MIPSSTLPSTGPREGSESPRKWNRHSWTHEKESQACFFTTSKLVGVWKRILMQVWLRDSSVTRLEIQLGVWKNLLNISEILTSFSHVSGIGVSCFPGFAVSNRVSSSAQAAEESTFLSCTALVTSSCCTQVVANASKWDWSTMKTCEYRSKC